MTHQEVIASINGFFSDTSRPASETLEGLQEIQTEVENCIDALKEDLRREGRA